MTLLVIVLITAFSMVAVGVWLKVHHVDETDTDDRLRELRDNFQSLYNLLYPDPLTRPVAGIGWCPYQVITVDSSTPSDNLDDEPTSMIVSIPIKLDRTPRGPPFYGGF